MNLHIPTCVAGEPRAGAHPLDETDDHREGRHDCSIDGHGVSVPI